MRHHHEAEARDEQEEEDEGAAYLTRKQPKNKSSLSQLSLVSVAWVLGAISNSFIGLVSRTSACDQIHLSHCYKFGHTSMSDFDD